MLYIGLYSWRICFLAWKGVYRISCVVYHNEQVTVFCSNMAYRTQTLQLRHCFIYYRIWCTTLILTHFWQWIRNTRFLFQPSLEQWRHSRRISQFTGHLRTAVDCDLHQTRSDTCCNMKVVPKNNHVQYNALNWRRISQCSQRYNKDVWF